MQGQARVEGQLVLAKAQALLNANEFQRAVKTFNLIDVASANEPDLTTQCQQGMEQAVGAIAARLTSAREKLTRGKQAEACAHTRSHHNMIHGMLLRGCL